jgi:FtsP/CotA-like multicopper oxidase with cupredoxin domain
VFKGKRQNVSLVALDGVPLHYGEPGARTYAAEQSAIFLPPAGRAEFVITAPPLGYSGVLLTESVFRGAGDDDDPTVPVKTFPRGVRAGQDDIDPTRPLLSIETSTEAPTPRPVKPMPELLVQSLNVPLSTVRPAHKRKFYFSERVTNPGKTNMATEFFITEDGQSPSAFDPHSLQPSVTVQQGTVEDWTIENRSQESHTFHTHQLHFIAVGSQGGTGWEEPTLRDTINVPPWSGLGKYPNVTLRLDFRDPRIVGTFPFHCHILQHVDGGMMGLIRVERDSSKPGN